VRWVNVGKLAIAVFQRPFDLRAKLRPESGGVPLFQEQAMKIAIDAAGFSPAEADELQRSMATFEFKGMVSQFQEKLTQGMLRNGYTPEYAQQVFKQLEGFGSYGFPESHAASFAQLVYVSAWIKCYYPDVFALALLNSMPMGLYQPAQLVRDAQEHGVEERLVDINYSHWDNCFEEKGETYFTLRLGIRQVKSIRAHDVERLLSKRGAGYTNVDSLRDAGFSKAFLEALADADVFRSLGLDRREALWQLSKLDFSIALFKRQATETENVALPAMTLPEHVVQDYASTSLKPHPVRFVRPKLEQLGIVTAKNLSSQVHGMPVKVAGIVLVRQRSETAKGVCFITLEDETGFSNLVVFANVFEQHRNAILQAHFIMVEGTLQREGDVVHVIASACYNISKLLRTLTSEVTDSTQSSLFEVKEGDIKKESSIDADTQKKSAFSKGPNFH
jgi:error-prone DNA polymerase